MRSTLKTCIVSAGLLLALTVYRPVKAEVNNVRLSHGYSVLFLPLIVMRDQGFLEKRAAENGLGRISAKWVLADGGDVIRDAMLANKIDIAGIGAPGFVQHWSKAVGIPGVEVVGLGGMSSSALSLNTSNPRIRSLRDFSGVDRIAVPGLRGSLAAVLLQMMAERTFGAGQYAALDRLTVNLSHPEATQALLAGTGGVTAHFAPRPFSTIELKNPNVHEVLNSSDVLGPVTINVVFSLRSFAERNPRLVAAFMAAQEDANRYISRHPQEAARIYLRYIMTGASEQEVIASIQDKDTRFSTVPMGMMEYSRFLFRTGAIRMVPKQWSDLFLPTVRHENAS